MNDAQLLARAAQAKSILDADIYKESWEACRLAIFEKIAATELGQPAVIEDLHRCLKLLASARGNLEAFMKAGKMAEIRLFEEEERRGGKVHLFRP
jgi:hypothetical protein